MMEKGMERVFGEKLCAGVPPVFVAIALAIVARSAAAVVVDGVAYDATTGYVLMSANDTGEYSSVTGALHWVGQTEPPQPDKNYFIQTSKILRTPKNGNTAAFPLLTFAGQSLTLGGGQITHALNSGMGEDKTPGIAWGNLRILGGKYIAGCQLNVIKNSQISFVPTSLGPVEFDFNQTSPGTKGTGLYFRQTTFSNTSSGATAIFYNSKRTDSTGIIFRDCDFSGFNGSFQFGKQGIGTSTYADFGNGTVFPGTVVIETNAEFHATATSGSLTLDALTIKQGGVFYFPKTDVTLNVGTLRNEDGRMVSLDSASAPGIVNVTNNFVTDRTLVLSGFGYTVTTGTAQTASIPFMSVPEGTTIHDGLFEYKPVSGGLPNIVVSSETVGGTICLSVAKKEIETIKNRDSSANGGSSFQESRTSNWSDGRQPHSGVDYVVGLSGYGNQLMTGDTTGAANAAAGACMFAGDSFTVLGGTLALCDVYLNVFSNLTVVAGGTISAFTGQGRANVLRGNTLTLLQSSTSPSALISCQGGAWLVVENELLGSADLDICRHSNASKMYACLIDLRALNTNYTGRITLACGGWRTGTNWEGDNMSRQVTLNVDDARNLGGPLASFTYDALRVRDCQILSVTNDVAFTEQTRGLFIDGCARFNVASGKTLTLAQPLTFAGKLRKEGAGMLAMGGTVAFTADRLSDPDGLDGTNVLEVVEGYVKPLSKTAADGLALTFENGTSLALDIAPSNADMAQYGLYNVKADAPVTLAEGMSTLPVTLNTDGIVEPAPVYEVALATVKDRTLATALKGRLSVTKPWPNYVAELSLRDNPDDGNSCTVVARIRLAGLTVIFR